MATNKVTGYSETCIYQTNITQLKLECSLTKLLNTDLISIVTHLNLLSDGTQGMTNVQFIMSGVMSQWHCGVVESQCVYTPENTTDPIIRCAMNVSSIFMVAPT